MTILEHHNKKEFSLNTFFKVKIPKGFKTMKGEYPFKVGYLFQLIDGDRVIRPKLRTKKGGLIVDNPIGNLEVIKRYN